MYLIRNIQCRDPYPQAKLEIFLKEGCVRKMCYKESSEWQNWSRQDHMIK